MSRPLLLPDHVRRGVLGQEREPGVVCRGDGPPERMPVDVPDLEVLVESTPPALFTATFPPLRTSEHSKLPSPGQAKRSVMADAILRNRTGRTEVKRLCARSG